jgi:hypothetical protein
MAISNEESYKSKNLGIFINLVIVLNKILNISLDNVAWDIPFSKMAKFDHQTNYSSILIHVGHKVFT